LLEQFQKGKNRKLATADSVERDNLAMVVACTEKITVLETDEGDSLNTPASIEAVLSDPRYGWLLDQISTAINDQSNFPNRQGRTYSLR